MIVAFGILVAVFSAGFGCHFLFKRWDPPKPRCCDQRENLSTWMRHGRGGFGTMGNPVDFARCNVCGREWVTHVGQR